MELELQEVISKFFKNIDHCKVVKFGSGLINRTFFLQHPEGDFLLQQINHQVFKDTVGLMQNIQIISEHLLQKEYTKSVLQVLPTISNKLFYLNKNGTYWRIFNFIKDTTSYDIPNTPVMVYQAAQSFGEFLFFLNKIPHEKIVDTIPDFHNTPLRFQQLKHAIEKDIVNRVHSTQEVIQTILDFSFLLKKINQLNPNLPTRLVHNDLKFNNLLFNKNNQVEAIIDWDTIMKGNILYDFGDMVRTMACTENEESTNFENVKINEVYLEKMLVGFTETTSSFLSKIEKDNLLLGGQFIIYEQAIRFLTDYLNGDIYYNITYTNQNLNRTKNQLALLKDLTLRLRIMDL